MLQSLESQGRPAPKLFRPAPPVHGDHGPPARRHSHLQLQPLLLSDRKFFQPDYRLLSQESLLLPEGYDRPQVG